MDQLVKCLLCVQTSRLKLGSPGTTNLSPTAGETKSMRPWISGHQPHQVGQSRYRGPVSKYKMRN